jgi:hypothetical protein
MAEEMRLSIENSKRWAEQERERANREMSESIKEAIGSMERDSRDLKVSKSTFSKLIFLRILFTKLRKN